jgi:hypothetical protein
MKHKLRWWMLTVPVALTVAAACTAPGDPAPTEAQLATGFNILLLIVEAIAAFATLGANGGNGSTLCVFVFCQFYPG